MILMKAKTALLSLTLLIMGVFSSLQLQAADKPNILVIFGDDIGDTNIVAKYHQDIGFICCL